MTGFSFWIKKKIKILTAIMTFFDVNWLWNAIFNGKCEWGLSKWNVYTAHSKSCIRCLERYTKSSKYIRFFVYFHWSKTPWKLSIFALKTPKPTSGLTGYYKMTTQPSNFELFTSHDCSFDTLRLKIEQ